MLIDSIFSKKGSKINNQCIFILSLQKGVARLLTDAIHSVGELKPKFPFMSVTNSSLRFIAIYLKVKYTYIFESFFSKDIILCKILNF